MNHRFTIQPLTALDEPFLWDMLYLAIYIPEDEPQLPRKILEKPDIAHYARHWGQRPGDLGLKAVETATGKPVGAAWLRLLQQPDPGYGYVNASTPELSIALLPGYRGQGLGELLITSLLEEASRTFAAVSLSVSPENPAARLYRRLGFEVVSQSDSSLTMLKKLQ